MGVRDSDGEKIDRRVRILEATIGLRWAVMGPTLLFHLGGDDGGLATFCERYADSFNRWWEDLGDPRLDGATAQRLVDGLVASVDGESIDDLARRRDSLLAAVVSVTHS